MGRHRDVRGVNILDGGAPFYDCYECADGQYVAIGSIEPQFYALLREATGLADDPAFDAQFDAARWPALKDKLAAIFLEKSRDEWCAIMERTDICFAPVLSLGDAPLHPHNIARGTFVEVGGAIQPAPAPRFSGTTTPLPQPAAPVGADSDALLAGLGYTPDRIAQLRSSGVLA